MCSGCCALVDTRSRLCSTPAGSDPSELSEGTARSFEPKTASSSRRSRSKTSAFPILQIFPSFNYLLLPSVPIYHVGRPFRRLRPATYKTSLATLRPPWVWHGTRRVTQLPQGIARSHLSFFDRQKSHETCGCLRRRDDEADSSSRSASARFNINNGLINAVVLLSMLVLVRVRKIRGMVQREKHSRSAELRE